MTARTLEELLRDTAKRGEFVHLSVLFDGQAFSASFASSSRAGGYATGAESYDPVRAIRSALEAAPMARLYKGPSCGKTETVPVVVDDPALE